MNGFPSIAASPWIEVIGWMLLHSLWQGAGVAMGLVLVLWALRRAPSPARYLAACAAMTLLVALPAATLLRSDESAPPAPARHDAAAGRGIVGRIMPLTPGRITMPPPMSSQFADRIGPMLPAIVACWMAGVGLCSLRLLGGCFQARLWVRHQTHLLAAPWPDRFERLKERLGVRGVVGLLESARVEVPMVVGWLRPAILVPAAALSGLSPAELEAILAHELAHIRRHDYLVNLIQCVVEVLMFYHPAAWWISRVIRHEREQCCDDLAVAACHDRLTYARALAAMEGLRVPAFSPSPAASGGVLLARVRRILEPQEESMNPVRILIGLGVVLATALVWSARAGDDRPAPNVTTQVTLPALPDAFPELPWVEGAPTDRTGPFPNRSYADIITSVEEAPVGRFIISSAATPSAAERDWDARNVGEELAAWLGLASSTRVAAKPDHDNIPDNPPGEAEIWDRVPRSVDGLPAFYNVQRKRIRTIVEKIGDKVDPVRVYPLFGPGQLVHKHYKCTVYYDLIYDADYPIPFHHVDHKVAVVYIDKDYLRRVPMPSPEPDRRPGWRRLALVNAEIDGKRRARQAGYGEPEWLLDHQEFEALLDPSGIPPEVK